MFILRTIKADGSESNQVIGEAYTLHKKGSVEFKKYESSDKADESIYAYLYYSGSHFSNDNGAIIPLDNKDEYYIMNVDGQTFSNLTINK